MSDIEGLELQYHLKIKEGDIGKYVILPGDPKRCKVIAEYFDDLEFVADNREYMIFNGTLSGEKVTVCSTGIGGPSTAIALEELVNCGAHTFIRVGTCGGMQLDEENGDVVIATGAIRMGGAADEYAPIEFPAVADFEVVDALIDSCKEQGIRYHAGISHCKDSFYGQNEPEKSPVSYELINKWNAFVKLGTKCSEMESDTLFIVAAARKVRCGSCFVIVHNQEKAKLGLPNPMVMDTTNPIKAAVGALKKLIENDRKKKNNL